MTEHPDPNELKVFWKDKGSAVVLLGTAVSNCGDDAVWIDEVVNAYRRGYERLHGYDPIPEWNKPEISYEFGKRKFELRTGDASIYSTSPDF